MEICGFILEMFRSSGVKKQVGTGLVGNFGVVAWGILRWQEMKDVTAIIVCFHV